MSLPKQVQDQLDEAKKMMESVAEPSVPPEDEPSTPEPQTTPEAEKPPVESADPKPEPTPESDPAPAEAPSNDDDLRKANDRYATLKAKYDAEVPRLARELKEMRREIEHWRSVAEQKQTQTDPKPGDGGKPNAEDRSQYIPQKLKEEYGEELGSLVAEVAERIADDRMKKVQNEVSQARTDTFFDRLERTIPNFRQTNEDQSFITWLGETDGLAEHTRDDVLRHAVQQQDAKAIQRIFAAWQATVHGDVKPKATAKPSVERMVAPSKANVSGKPTQGEKTYTVSEYQRMHEDIARGKYTDTDAKRIKTELDRAFAEGRIRAA